MSGLGEGSTSVFDDSLEKIAGYIAGLCERGRPYREYRLPPGREDALHEIVAKVGPGANPGIILRSDTFVELGNPSAGSCACLLWTNDCSRVDDGRIRVIGSDVPESAGKSLAFGQVVMVAGSSLGPEQHPSLEQAQYVADQVEGYMVKTASRNMWGRVSKEAGAKGFDFKTLGGALRVLVKDAAAEVEAVEVLFVTSSKEDVAALASIAGKVRQAAETVVKEHWKARGYDLDCDLSCASCDDKGVCDDIRDVVATIKKNLRRRESGERAGNGERSDDKSVA